MEDDENAVVITWLQRYLLDMEQKYLCKLAKLVSSVFSKYLLLQAQRSWANDTLQTKSTGKIYTVVNHMHILTGESSAREW